MAIVHNQTDCDLIDEADIKTVGLGLFLFPDIPPDVGPTLRVRSVSGITFPHCHDLARLALAFKWIPESRLSDPEINLAKGESCSGLCVTRCVKIPCWCIDGVCQRIDPS
jgi:hypothetical protein